MAEAVLAENEAAAVRSRVFVNAVADREARAAMRFEERRAWKERGPLVGWLGGWLVGWLVG